MNLHYSKTSKEDIWSCYQCMYHRVFNYILLYHVPFFRKNILTTIFVQVCSTTLRFCTSSAPQRDIWSCYRHKMHANTLLQNLLLYDILVICCFTIPWIYTTPKTTSITPSIICGFATLWIYTTPKLAFWCFSKGGCFTVLWIYTTPKLNFDLLHWCELFYYPAILHLFKCLNKHLKLLPSQNARNYTTSKLHDQYILLALSFYYPMNLHYSKTGDSAS